jgi:hypothetical protein
MPLQRRPNPSSLRPNVPRIQTPAGPKPVGLADALAYVADQVAAQDRVQQLASPNPINTYDEPIASLSWPDDSPGFVTLHPRDAAMLAVASLLRTMKWHSRELGELVKDPARPPVLMQHKMAEVRLEWPDWDSPEIPVDKAVVSAAGPAQWDPASRQPYLIDETLGVFDHLAGLSSDRPMTVLRYLGEYQIPITVFAWFAHRDHRRGFEARLCAMLAASRIDDVFSRRVVVPQYFDQEARISLGESSRPDDAASAAANRWPIEVSMTIEVAQVELVLAPGISLEPVAEVEINGLG